MLTHCRMLALAVTLTFATTLPIDSADARGTRVGQPRTAAQFFGPAPRRAAQRSVQSRPRLAASRVTTTRSTATRIGTPRTVSRSVATRTSVSANGTRVAGFAQRAPTAFNGFNGFNGAVARSVNGLKNNDLEFRTGDFFERQQNIGGQ